MKTAFFRNGRTSRLWLVSRDRLIRTYLLLLGLAVTSLTLAAVAQVAGAGVAIDDGTSPLDEPSVATAIAPTSEVMQALPFL